MKPTAARQTIASMLTVHLAGEGVAIAGLLVLASGISFDCRNESEARRAVELLAAASCPNAACMADPDSEAWLVSADYPAK